MTSNLLLLLLLLLPPSLQIQDRKMMIFGADVNHASVGSMKPSFVSVTGSIDVHGRKHVAVVRAQNPRKEVITDLQVKGGVVVVVVVVVVVTVHGDAIGDDTGLMAW